MNIWIKRSVWILIGGGLLFFAGDRIYEIQQKQAQPSAKKKKGGGRVITVSVNKVRLGTLRDDLLLTGALKAKEEVDVTAKATGRSKASVYQDKARGERIAEDVQKEIAGTDIEDSGVQLDALAAASHDNQRKAVEAVVLGHAKDVRDVLHKKRRTKSQIRLDEFDRAIQYVVGINSKLPSIDIPNLDSKRLSRTLVDLRNAGKIIEGFINTIQRAHDGNPEQ